MLFPWPCKRNDLRCLSSRGLMTFSVTHQRRLSVTKSTEHISRAGRKSWALWCSLKAGGAPFMRGRLQGLSWETLASHSLIVFVMKTGDSTYVTVVTGGNASGKQPARFGWSGCVGTQEPAACEELLQRDGEVLELVQGQLGESQRQRLNSNRRSLTTSITLVSELSERCWGSALSSSARFVVSRAGPQLQPSLAHDCLQGHQ